MQTKVGHAHLVDVGKGHSEPDSGVILVDGVYLAVQVSGWFLNSMENICSLFLR